MTGNGISMHNVKESLAALRIQRRHKIDKDARCTQSKNRLGQSIYLFTNCWEDAAQMFVKMKRLKHFDTLAK